MILLEKLSLKLSSTLNIFKKEQRPISKKMNKKDLSSQTIILSDGRTLGFAEFGDLIDNISLYPLE